MSKRDDNSSKPFQCGQHLVGFDEYEDLSKHFAAEHGEQDDELRKILGEEDWKYTEKPAKLETLIRSRERAVLQPIRDIFTKLDDDYGEFEALDDIEKYLAELQKGEV